MKKILTICVISILLAINTIYGQSSVSLDELISQHLSQSYRQTLLNNNLKQSEHQFDLFHAMYKPQMGLNLQIPAYTKTSSQIVQPNGSIVFQSISQNNGLANLTLQQNIALTGGTVFALSELRRFDDFSFSTHSYNGIPIRIGISQPLWGFNAFKWDRKLQPMAYQLEQSTYKYESEHTKLELINLYFDILLAREIKSNALTNRSNQAVLMTIGKEKLELGKIAIEEMLQIETGYDNASIQYQQAQYEESAALRALNTYLKHTNFDTSHTFVMPMPLAFTSPDKKALIESLKAHTPQILESRYQIEQAQRNASKIKVDYGFQANLYASFGWARGSQNIEDIYQSPYIEQQVSLGLSMPIVDWGRRKSANHLAQLQTQSATINAQLTEANLIALLENLIDNSIHLQQRIAALETIREKTEARYQIAQEKYVMGRMTLTDLNLAREEKDLIRLQYLSALRQLYNTIFEIRKLTGYDPITQSKI